MGFLGDEGRDALIVKRMIVDHRFTLLGPITSVGLMHLGPMYYYFMIPFLWASNLNPVGPAIMVALFSLATTVLIWKMCQEFLGTRAANLAALFYTLSPFVITYSHSSWNPNILPFFALCIVYSLVKAIHTKKITWLFVAGLNFGIAIQLHYVALVFVFIGLVYLFTTRVFPLLKSIFTVAGGVFVTFLPFVIFEIRHSFINTKTIYDFVTRTGNEKTFSIMQPISSFWDLFVRLFWRLLTIESAQLAKAVGVFLLLGVLYQYKNEINKKTKLFLQALLVWIGVGLLVLSLYSGNVYDYYLMFVFPLPFIFLGLVFANISKKNVLGAISIFVASMFLVIVYSRNTPILQPPNRLAFQSEEIANFILDKTSGEPYNFALIAGQNSDHAYRYFLEVNGYSPVTIENPTLDPLRNSVTKQLFVVCEEAVCQPLGHPLWEIAGFGPAEIVDEWQVGLFKVFKLKPFIASE